MNELIQTFKFEGSNLRVIVEDDMRHAFGG